MDGNQESVTINAGTGNDIIYGDSSSYGVIYQLTYGDGTDTVYNYKSNDTISIASNYLYTTLTSGNNLLVSIYGGGTMNLSGAKGTTLNIKGGVFSPANLNISNYNNNTVVNGTSNADTINNYGSTVKVYSYSGNDKIINSGNRVTIDADSGNDTVSTDNSTNISINSGSGNDSIFCRIIILQ